MAGFGRPFTPRTWLRSPRNFGNARFGRFANFDVLTPIFLFFRKQIRILFLGFSSFSADFRRAGLFLTSKSSSSRFFALNGQIFRSVRRLELIFGFFTVRTSTCVEIWAPPRSALAANPTTFWVLAGVTLFRLALTDVQAFEWV